MDGGKIVSGNVENVARRRLGDDQRMTVGAGHDVHDRDGLVVFVDLVGGQLAAQDFCEYVLVVVGGHGNLG
jgi:hypothetical protein